MEKKIKGIIIVLALVTVAVILCINNVNADEPPNKSIIIKLSTENEESETMGAVLEDGSGEKSKATYTLNIENRDHTNDRNVTIKFQWEEYLEDWNVSAKPARFIISDNNSIKIKVTVLAPSNTIINQQTIVKVYAWEYEGYNEEPPLKDQNTTLGVDGGEVKLITTVVPNERVEINVASTDKISKTGNPGQITSYNLLIKNTGYVEQKFGLYGEVIKNQNTDWNIIFPESDLTDELAWNQEFSIKMDVKVPINAEAGKYTVKVTASGISCSGTLNVVVDVAKPDLFIDADRLYLSHKSILEGQSLKIFVKIGNKGSIIKGTFSLEVTAKNSDGGWKTIGIKNITGLKYGEDKIISFTYEVNGEGVIAISAKVNSNNKITEQDNTNNNFDVELTIVKTEDTDNSFHSQFISIISCVSLVSIFSMIVQKKKKL